MICLKLTQPFPESLTYSKTVALLTGSVVLEMVSMGRNGVSAIDASDLKLFESSSNLIQCLDGIRTVQMHRKGLADFWGGEKSKEMIPCSPIRTPPHSLPDETKLFQRLKKTIKIYIFLRKNIMFELNPANWILN